MLSDFDIEILPDRFAPTLVQEYINKLVEIRVFFLRRKLFPMAIFSQLDEQTSTDYRNYNDEKPNRGVPFSFPGTIKSKIISFIKKSGLDTGSIDIIQNNDGDFIFLEVNPVGQFGWVSQNCNYYLEKRIAEDLCKTN